MQKIFDENEKYFFRNISSRDRLYVSLLSIALSDEW